MVGGAAAPAESERRAAGRLELVSPYWLKALPVAAQFGLVVAARFTVR
jgi:hypothetical protein